MQDLLEDILAISANSETQSYVLLGELFWEKNECTHQPSGMNTASPALRVTSCENWRESSALG